VRPPDQHGHLPQGQFRRQPPVPHGASYFRAFLLLAGSAASLAFHGDILTAVHIFVNKLFDTGERRGIITAWLD
jgi:hypothetical protein